MNIANGAEITLLIESTSVLHGKIKLGDFITKVDGTPVEKPNELFLIRGPSHFWTLGSDVLPEAPGVHPCTRKLPLNVLGSVLLSFLSPVYTPR